MQPHPKATVKSRTSSASARLWVQLRAASAPAALCLAGLVACQGAPEPVVAVGGVEIPRAALDGLAEPERQTLLDLVAFGAAIANGEVDKLTDPLVARAEDASLVTALPAALGAERMGIDEPRLREAYTAAPEWELELGHVVRLAEEGATPEQHASARRIAAEVAARAMAGEDFGTLAGEFSEEPGAAERGGLLEPGRRGTWVEPFWQAALTLSPGQTTDVVETPYGYHVIRLEDRRPVPFEEANRTALLARLVPSAVAAEAMGEWAATTGAVLVHPPALAAAREAIRAALPPADTLSIARGGGAVYTGEDLIAGWAGLPTEEREALERADETAFARWVESDARTVLWADAARKLALAPDSAAEETRGSWLATVDLWAQLFGFQPGMEGPQLYEAARLATLSGAAELRAQRRHLRSFRPLLRALYPAALPEG